MIDPNRQLCTSFSDIYNQEMEDNNLLTSIMAILGSDPLHQVNRLQMFESKFHELSNLYKILAKSLEIDSK